MRDSIRNWTLGTQARLAAISTGVVLCVVLMALLLTSAAVPAQASTATRTPTTAAFIPQDAIVTSTLRLSSRSLPTKWEGTPAVQAIQSFLGQRIETDVERDIRPWLGNEVALAVVPGTTATAPGYLLVLTLADGDQAREFLELLWQRQALAGSPPRLTTIDSAVALLPAADSPLWPMALVGDHYWLIASTPAVLHQSLRAAQAPDLNLTRRSQYHSALAGLPPQPLGLIQVQIPAAIAAAGLAQPRSNPPTASLTDGLISLNLDRQTLALQTVLSGHPPHPKRAASGTASSGDVSSGTAARSPATRLPETVVAAAIGENLANLWQATAQEMQTYQQLPRPLIQLQQWLATSSGQAANRALTSWLTGTYAVARTVSGDSILVTDHTPEANLAIAQLDRLAAADGLTVAPLTVQRQLVTAWTRLNTRTVPAQTGGTRNQPYETTVETQVVALHAEQNGHDIWATSIAALANTLSTTEPKLVESARFQQSLAAPNNSIYIDGTALVSQLSGQFPMLDLLGAAAQPLLNRLDTLSLSQPETLPDNLKAKAQLRFTPL